MTRSPVFQSQSTLYNALIRTHHIRSRKKISALKDAAKRYGCGVLLKSDGSPPGVMYVEGSSEDEVKSWVESVRSLHYLNYELVSPAALTTKRSADAIFTTGVVEEVDDLKKFAKRMEERGILGWWRSGMGFAKDDS